MDLSQKGGATQKRLATTVLESLSLDRTCNMAVISPGGHFGIEGVFARSWFTAQGHPPPAHHHLTPFQFCLKVVSFVKIMREQLSIHRWSDYKYEGCKLCSSRPV